MDKGLFAVILELSWRRLPAAAFLGLANRGSFFSFRRMFNFLKFSFKIKTSPLTSKRSGIGVSDSRKTNGIDLNAVSYTHLTLPTILRV